MNLVGRVRHDDLRHAVGDERMRRAGAAVVDGGGDVGQHGLEARSGSAPACLAAGGAATASLRLPHAGPARRRQAAKLRGGVGRGHEEVRVVVKTGAQA